MGIRGFNVDLRSEMMPTQVSRYTDRGLTAAIHFQKPVRSHFELEYGLGYAYRAHHSGMLNSFSYQDYSALVIKTTTNQFISAPIRFRFVTGKHRVQFFTSVGIALQYLLQQKTEETYFDMSGNPSSKRVEYTNPNLVNRLCASAEVSFGARYKLTKRYALQSGLSVWSLHNGSAVGTILPAFAPDLAFIRSF